MKDLSSRYRRRGDSMLIEMKLSTLAQLFNSFDPAPFLDKDLDDDAESYIVDTALEFSPKTPLLLSIQLPREAIQADTGEAVSQAIHNYFEYKAQSAHANLRHKLREGRVSLVIGLAFLAACLTARQIVAEFGGGTPMEIVQEGLLISGWVAMWRPIQTFLYDWWPLRHLRALYDRLSRIQVEVLPFP